MRKSQVGGSTHGPQPQRPGICSFAFFFTLCAHLIASPAAVAAPRSGDFDVTEKSIEDLQAAQASGLVTARELVEQYLARIHAYDRKGPHINAIVRLNPEALKEAQELDAERRNKGVRGPLHGIPILVKDNYSTAGIPTSGGSIALATMQTADDATVVKRLRDAGAVILGKTTLQELAVGTTTASSYTGYTRNPYDLDRSPGGSSGGSGAAVAANFAAAATGSDTCGSIRVPAAFQNLYGLRSTYGLVSRTGLVPLSSSQDIAGPITRSVRDLAIMMDVMAGADPADSSTQDADRHKPKSYVDSLRPDGLKGARIGVIRSLFTNDLNDADGNALVERAFKTMRASGAEVFDVTIPDVEDNLKDTSSIVYEFKYELAAFLAKQPGAPIKSLDEVIAQGLDHELIDARIRERNAAKVRDEAAYSRTKARRRAMHELVLRIMNEQRLDALAYPVSTQPPPLIGVNPEGGGSCQLSATTGLPAMAIPVGFVKSGLPIGVELMGRDFAEPALFALAYGWEQTATPRREPFSTPRLINGGAPKSVRVGGRTHGKDGTLIVQGEYAPATSQLDLHVRLRGVAAEDVIAVVLHRGNSEHPGPAFEVLVERGLTHGHVTLRLPTLDRENLAAGRLMIRAYTTNAPLGAAQLALSAPGIDDTQLSQQ